MSLYKFDNYCGKTNPNKFLTSDRVGKVYTKVRGNSCKKELGKKYVKQKNDIERTPSSVHAFYHWQQRCKPKNLSCRSIPNDLCLLDKKYWHNKTFYYLESREKIFMADVNNDKKMSKIQSKDVRFSRLS